MIAERPVPPLPDDVRELLTGTNQEECIVAATPGDDSHIRVYRRTSEGVTSTLLPSFPFFFVSDDALLKDVRSRHWLKELAGTNAFRYLCVFSRWTDMWAAVQGVIAAYNASAPRPVYAYAEIPALLLRPDPVSQYFLQSGTTCFKGMAFSQIHRLQVDIETFSAGTQRFSNAARPSDRIVLIALSDNRGWQTVLDGRTLAEPEMLARFCAIVSEKDPDILEGHNIFQFDLPYLLSRCALHGIEPSFGRDGASVRAPEPSAGGRFEQLHVEVPGRNVVDTYLLVEAYDARHGTLESYGLKAAARHFGLARPDRVLIDGRRISWTWEHDPDLLVRYALDDVEETRLLSDLLLPAFVDATRMLPLPLAGSMRSGAAAKAEALLLREYLRRRRSVPRSPAAAAPAVPEAELLWTGLFSGVCYAAFDPLSPSLMLAQTISPATDEAGVFLPLLRAVEALRPHDGGAAQEQGADILLHAFSGYLAAPKALFADPDAATRLTRSVRKVIRDLAGSIAARQGIPIHVDPRGVFFVPPRYLRTAGDEERFVASLNEGLPQGCRLTLRGRYKAMLSYRKNNYALLGADDRIVMRGNALDVRAQERYLRTFVSRAVEALLRGTPQAIHALLHTVRREIRERKLTIADFARTETLRSDPDIYLAEVEEEKRNRSASYEAALAANRRWRAGDRVAYYVAGTEPRAREFAQSKLAEEWNPEAPDENSAFYLRRLDEQFRKFQVFFSAEDYERIAAVDEAFDFSNAPVAVVSKPALPEVQAEGEEAEAFAPRIWLDEEEG